MKKSKRKATPSKPASKPKSKSAPKVAPKAPKPAAAKKPAAKRTALQKPKPVADKKAAAQPVAVKPPAPVKPKVGAQAASSTPSKGKAKVPENKGRNRLNREELKYFENLLNEKKETLLQELGYLEDNTMRLNAKEGAGDLSSHAYHLADHATETQDREQAFHMASREGRYLFYLEEALDRVRQGVYGICKKCGKLIPKARLEAVPTAKMCIECKSKQEQASEAEVAA